MSALICYDDSDSSRRALSVARRTLAAGPVVLLHIYSAPEEVLADAFGAESTMPRTGLASQERLESLAARRAREVIEQGLALADGLDVHARVREAPDDEPVWQAILDVADEVEAELIVAGTHGTTAAADAMLGSVSGGLIRHSVRPVLVVPAGRS